MLSKIKKTIITIFTDKPYTRPSRTVFEDLETLRHHIAKIELYRNAGQEECAAEALTELNRQVSGMFADYCYLETGKRRGLLPRQRNK